MKNYLVALAALCGVAAAADLSAQTYGASETTRVSIGTFTGAVEANAAANNPRVSRNGRFVVFDSTASNLVNPGTTPGRRHVYLLDRQAGTLERITFTAGGGEPTADSYSPSISADGRYVAFSSDAPISDFVEVCFSDFCHVNKSHLGTHVYVRDRLANQNMLISQVTLPVLVADFDEFGVQKTEEDPNDPAKKIPVFVETTKRIAAVVLGTNSSTSFNPVITADGKYVAYDTSADNLAGLANEDIIYEGVVGCAGGVGCDFNWTTGILNDPTIILEPTIGNAWYDGNGVRDVYVRDGAALQNTFVNLFCKYHDPQKCAVKATADAIKPSISDDSKYVSFESNTPFLDLDFNGTTDVFLAERDLFSGEVATLRRVSNNTSRILAGNGASSTSAISGDGRFVAFQSSATNMVSGDTNGVSDVLIYDTTYFKVVRCAIEDNTQATAAVTQVSISGAGEYVVMQTATTAWGVGSGISNIYIGQLVRDADGVLADCVVELASIGAGSGGNNSSTLASVGLVPRAQTIDGELVRTQVPAIVYRTLATDLHSGGADGNGVADILQAPTCTAADAVGDQDNDGTVDCFDQCWKNPLKVADSDSDGDGIADCEDGCPSDSGKSVAGQCGCGVTDADGDSDGTADCVDECDDDPAKVEPGTCGCGIPDEDANDNDIIDCVESVNPTPTATATPTPGATPTPTATATPAPTQNPGGGVTSFVPARPRVSRLDNNRFSINLTNPNATFAIESYNVSLYRVNGDSLTLVKSFNRSGPKFRLNLKNAGRYKIGYKLTSDGYQTQSSANSSTMRVR